ncbi:MAG: prephenate dehydrogenase/arogenate dehydrogenase family protein [SAR86 cluster bacterium]|jgi:prephenate dehydrogenase|uniref:Prephenate dehydrogenase/arogenate dehydrogenase family protein n=1 Tax=SAR86 cluster bacterium TaxID=2030880 RepID=A0A937M370_9GAMM|nr:prephenate dehydrogenase/arogenate dehydrogenase family protein [SAR86 cluster bacterium]
MNSIVIIGLGLMGGSVAKALKNKNPEIVISAFDHNDSALDLALDVGIIDKKISTLEEINKLEPKDVDIIIIAVPVIESLKVFDAINGLFNSDITITDTASAKSLISDHLEENYSSPTNIILSHPMAGSHNTGVGYADEAMFNNKKVLITELQNPKDHCLQLVTNLWESLGAAVFKIDPIKHDEIMSYASHLPHVISYAVLNSIMKNPNENITTFSAGGLKDFVRIGGSDPKMWTDIFLSNKDSILKAINAYKDSLDELSELLEADNEKSLQDLLTTIKEYKNSKF